MATDWIKVTKLEAAQRQVRTAIRLWFDDADAVSIHTLLYAALEIIDGLCKRKGGIEDLFFNTPGMKEAGVIRTVKDWPNFFKHGRQHELGRVLDFNPYANLVFFSACLRGLDHLGSQDDVERALAAWIYVHHPEFFDKEAAAGLAIPPEAVERMRGFSKREFFEGFLKAKLK